jgi:hypothetical protein
MTLNPTNEARKMVPRDRERKKKDNVPCLVFSESIFAFQKSFAYMYDTVNVEQYSRALFKALQ